MNNDFNELFDNYKKLNESEKKTAIITFLKNNIKSLQELNKAIGNNLSLKDIDSIVKVNSSDELDIIYELLHLLTEQVELFCEKISNEFYE